PELDTGLILTAPGGLAQDMHAGYADAAAAVRLPAVSRISLPDRHLAGASASLIRSRSYTFSGRGGIPHRR
ncbi:hypothetical protein ACW9HQ_38265, partial [Nocardia gipuzkoensis]